MGKSTFMVGPARMMRIRFHSGLRLEGAPAILRQDRGSLLLVLLEHLHEAAEGKQADAVRRLPPTDLQQLGPEAEAEGQDLHAEDLGEDEVPRLVDEDQRADQQHEVQKVQGGGGPLRRRRGRGRRGLAAVDPADRLLAAALGCGMRPKTFLRGPP